MATNNYLQLDGKKYTVVFDTLRKRTVKPGNFRQTLTGATDVSYGPAPYEIWSCVLRVPMGTPPTGWGNYDNIVTTLRKLQKVSFYTMKAGAAEQFVHILDGFDETSLTPDVYGDSNIMNIAISTMVVVV